MKTLGIGGRHNLVGAKIWLNYLSLDALTLERSESGGLKIMEWGADVVVTMIGGEMTRKPPGHRIGQRGRPQVMRIDGRAATGFWPS